MTDSPNPCDMLPKLRDAYYKLLSGSSPQSVEHQTGNGTKRVVTFHKTNIDALRDEISRLEAQCEGKRQRRVILAG